MLREGRRAERGTSQAKLREAIFSFLDRGLRSFDFAQDRSRPIGLLAMTSAERALHHSLSFRESRGAVNREIPMMSLLLAPSLKPDVAPLMSLRALRQCSPFPSVGDFVPQTPLRFASPLLDAPRGAQSGTGDFAPQTKWDFAR